MKLTVANAREKRKKKYENVMQICDAFAAKQRRKRKHWQKKWISIVSIIIRRKTNQVEAKQRKNKLFQKNFKTKNVLIKPAKKKAQKKTQNICMNTISVSYA